MYEPRPSDIALPQTVIIDLSAFVQDALEAAALLVQHADELERAA